MSSNVLPIRDRDDPPDPPDHLGGEARRLYTEIVTGWHMDPAALPLVQAACEQWEDYRAARKVLAREGPTVVNPDSGVVRQHPAAKVAKDALKAFRLCLKDLDLDPGEIT